MDVDDGSKSREKKRRKRRRSQRDEEDDDDNLDEEDLDLMMENTGEVSRSKQVQSRRRDEMFKETLNNELTRCATEQV